MGKKCGPKLISDAVECGVGFGLLRRLGDGAEDEIMLGLARATKGRGQTTSNFSLRRLSQRGNRSKVVFGETFLRPLVELAVPKSDQTLLERDWLKLTHL